MYDVFDWMGTKFVDSEVVNISSEAMMLFFIFNPPFNNLNFIILVCLYFI